MIIDLDKLHFRELFEIRHQRTSDRIQRSVRLTLTRKIYPHHAIGICYFVIACETVENERESLVAFNIAWTFEVFIEHRTDQVFGRGDKTRDAGFIRKLSIDQSVVVSEIDVDLHVERSAGGSWRARHRRGKTRRKCRSPRGCNGCSGRFRWSKRCGYSCRFRRDRCS